jgi:hypothetical protein
VFLLMMKRRLIACSTRRLGTLRQGARAARQHAPGDTRAWIRGEAVRRFGGDLHGVLMGARVKPLAAAATAQR